MGDFHRIWKWRQLYTYDGTQINSGGSPPPGVGGQIKSMTYELPWPLTLSTVQLIC